MTAAGVASLYAGLIDGIVVDAGDPDPPPEGLRAPQLPDADGGRRRPAGAGRAGARVRRELCQPRSSAVVRATAIIPVKRFGAAKQRLLDRLDRPQRAAIVKAMLADVLAAVERRASRSSG